MKTDKETRGQGDKEKEAPRVLGVVVCDLELSAVGTRSRAGEKWVTGRSVAAEVVGRLLEVRGVGEVVVLTPAEQMDRIWALLGPVDRVNVTALERRAAAIADRVRIGRAWNMLAWRGGAGQWTAFDEEYHPAAMACASAAAFNGAGAEHVLVVHSHGVGLDVELTSALVQHHLHKNHEMRVTYTPAAPGLCGMVLRRDIVQEMGEKHVMPWQLLGYDPKAPIFDTLIREACMQVDPALSKVPNRFCVDTERAWGICKELMGGGGRKWGSVAETCLAGARGVAPGVPPMDLSRVSEWPREVEVELSGKRLTSGARHMLSGRSGRGSRGDDTRAPLSMAHWVEWFSRQKVCDDLLVTFGGLGDPLLAEGLVEVVRAARGSGALSICVQTDLAGGDVEGLLVAIGEGLVDVVSVTMYGHTAETYAHVSGCDLHGAVMRNMERLAEATRGRGGVPLVVPRMLKVRETIPELESFFDFWIERCGWAVIDGPTDLAGSVEFKGVVDMGPPKRKACRRIWDRMVVRADGLAQACGEDVDGKLRVGGIGEMTIREMWTALQGLRDKHAAGRWGEVDPCRTCREWHRA